MHTTPASCPDIDELRRLYQGKLSDERRRRCQAHLSACPACARRWQQMQTETVPDPRLADCPVTDTRPTPAPSTEPATHAYLAPPRQAGELGWLDVYRIRGVLGEGGMGTVFDAEDTQLQRRVALKVMRPEMASNPLARQRFLQEARATAAIANDHIVTLYRVGEANGVLFLATEQLEGETLEERIEQTGQLPIAEVIRMGREIARGLAAAHAEGLIHRDVKPANIFLEARMVDGKLQERIKILDFGLARREQDEKRLTSSRVVVGTPHYISPEQARGQPVDARCDLFSLGCVLYRLLTGRLPFDGPDTLSILTALAVEDPVPVAQLRPDTPAELEQLVHRLLSRHPEDRPQTAEEVVTLLDQLAPAPDGPSEA